MPSKFQEGKSLTGLIVDGIRQFGSGLQDAMEWSAFSWLRPRLPVLIRCPDGSERILSDGRLAPSGSELRRPRYHAVLLPDSQVLQRTRKLPDLPREQLRQAVELDVSSNSPFPAADTVWGWAVDQREGHMVHVTVAMTSRTHALATVGSVVYREHESPPELWARIEPPLIISGFGERGRAAAERRRSAALLGATVLSIVLGLLVVATPTLQWYMQAQSAQRQVSLLQAQAAEVVMERDALTRIRIEAGAIETALRAQSDLLGVLEMLAAALPDTVYIQQLAMQGDDQVTINGRGPNISALLDRLGAHAQIRGLRATSAITRIDQDESVFNVEFGFLSAGATEAGAL